VRVIAGEFDGARGPAKTFTPMQVADLRLSGDERSELVVRDGWTTALVVLRGELRVNGAEPIRAAEVGLFDRHGSLIRVDAAADARALLLCGDPIDEPIFGTGPFVMNHPREIQQAIDDYESGRMGRLA
jgi:redox-sensitive bicupin YhaK (pirin superfamily)